MTQLHRERTEQVAAVYPVTCLARPFKRGGGGANASRTDCLRRALELVRGSGQLGKIASARGNANLPLRLNRCFAEFRQQRINGGAVLAEPSAKYVPVDCLGGLPLVWPIADAALSLDRQPAFQRRAQALDAHGLHQIGVHAGCEAALFLALHSVGSDRNNRRAGVAAVGFGGAEPPRQLMAIHVRHVDVGEHGGVAATLTEGLVTGPSSVLSGESAGAV